MFSSCFVEIGSDLESQRLYSQSRVRTTTLTTLLHNISLRLTITPKPNLGQNKVHEIGEI